VSVTFTLALTVLDSATGAAPEDVLVRGNADQSVGELARRLAGYVGRVAEDLVYGLRVERTGEHLRPDALLSSVDLLEGDTVTLLAPRGVERRRPRWAEDDAADPSAPGAVITLRPRGRVRG
jgi:hypothetical protein